MGCRGCWPPWRIISRHDPPTNSNLAQMLVTEIIILPLLQSQHVLLWLNMGFFNLKVDRLHSIKGRLVQLLICMLLSY